MLTRMVIYMALGIPSVLWSQAFDRHVIASSGGKFEISPVKLSWTLGEPVTETYRSELSTMTQGFQQSSLIITDLQEYHAFPYVMIFPNPTATSICIKSSHLPEGYTATLIDLLGRTLIRHVLTEESYMNLSGFPGGTYFLRLEDDNNQSKTYKIQKVDQL